MRGLSPPPPFLHLYIFIMIALHKYTGGVLYYYCLSLNWAIMDIKEHNWYMYECIIICITIIGNENS